MRETLCQGELVEPSRARRLEQPVMLDPKELARSACRIFGHRWERPRYAAHKDRLEGRLKIRRQRTCSRCGDVEAVER